MSAKTLHPPKNPDTSAYHAAVAALSEADDRLRSAQSRIADLDARIVALDTDVARIEGERARAFARGEIEQATALGQQFARNRDEAAQAIAEVKSMRVGLDHLWVAVYEAELAADLAHSSLFSALYEVEHAALVASLQKSAIRLWRASLASGARIPFHDWWKDLGVAVDQGDQTNFGCDVGLPVQEAPPSSALIPGTARSSSMQRAEINEIRERLAQEAANLARMAA